MGIPFSAKWPLKIGIGLAASAAHPRRNQIWVPPPPPPPGKYGETNCACIVHGGQLTDAIYPNGMAYAVTSDFLL